MSEAALPPARRPAPARCSPGSSRPPTRSTSATTSARCGSGWRSRTSTSRSSSSPTCTRSPSSRTPSSCASAALRAAAQLLAMGIDPERSAIFVQSQVPAHAQLGLGAAVPHRLRRGPPDDPVQGQVRQGRRGPARRSGCSPTRCSRPPTSCSTGPQYVPVGEDQRQHLELTRDLAQRFNHRYKKTFRLPEPYILKATAKIPDLQEPDARRCRSRRPRPAASSRCSTTRKVSAKKIRSAVTDSGARSASTRGEARRLQPADDLLRAHRHGRSTTSRRSTPAGATATSRATSPTSWSTS